jgi:hypothetical protein
MCRTSAARVCGRSLRLGRDALIVDPEYFDLAVGEAMTPFDLATTGLAKRKALRTELTLRCLNEAASGCVRDLT